MKVALILGVNGQDGSYLADVLLEKGYEVHGLHRRSSVDNLVRVAHLRGNANFKMHRGDLSDPTSIMAVLDRIDHDSGLTEIYNEADQDSVGWSVSTPAYQYEVSVTAVARLLEFVATFCPTAKVFQPCSATMFGDAAVSPAKPPQNEKTPFNPQSPYACAKAAAFHLCRYYREQRGLHVCTGILYNHDSPRRSDHYLLHKICDAAVEIAAGKRRSVALGNLDARVDIGFAGDYMQAAYMMLQLPTPDDYVIATGEAWTVGEMVEEAFRLTGRRATISECVSAGVVTVDPEFYRPTPATWLLGDASKIKQACGWEPKVRIKRLIGMLVAAARERKGL